SLSEDAIRAVPTELREGAYALGSRKYQVILRVIIPAASSGIIAALVLAIARAVGETMIVTIAAGLQPRLTLNPLVPIETMTAYIVQVTQGDIPHGTMEYQTIFAVGLMLFGLTFLINTVSFFMTRRMRQIYQ
ncbi:MAG: PstC family ABC transporter permease, partial [bacterium]